MDIGGSLTKIAYYSTVPLKQIVYGSQVPADDTSDELQVELYLFLSSPLSLCISLYLSLVCSLYLIHTHSHTVSSVSLYLLGCNVQSSERTSVHNIKQAISLAI